MHDLTKKLLQESPEPAARQSDGPLLVAIAGWDHKERGEKERRQMKRVCQKHSLTHVIESWFGGDSFFIVATNQPVTEEEASKLRGAATEAGDDLPSPPSVQLVQFASKQEAMDIYDQI